jgi:hypothetical protein
MRIYHKKRPENLPQTAPPPAPKSKIKDIRMKLWCDIAIAVAGSSNCTDINAPTKWADRVLVNFDNTFPETQKD